MTPSRSNDVSDHGSVPPESGSPGAYRIAARSDRSDRQRRFVRFQVDVPAHLVDYREAHARCTSLSLGGMFLETDRRLEVGTEVHVFLDLPTGLSLLVTGTVRWRTRRGAGLQHRPLGARETHALVGYLEILRTMGEYATAD